MRLSEMTTDQACEAIVQLTGPVANIVDDPALEPMLKDFAGRKGQNGLKIISAMIPRIVPMLLRDHKTDVYTVLSVLSGEGTEKIGRQKLTETIRMIQGCVDEDLVSFFRSSVPSTTKNESGSD